MAIQIKPTIEHQSVCPYDHTPLVPQKIIWQGMHICAESECASCQRTIVEDLKVGHAIAHPYQLDTTEGQLFGPESAKAWLGLPFLNAIQTPNDEAIDIKKEGFSHHKHVVILNCLDYLYGHCVLKLLNAERHATDDDQCGLVVIVPKFLRWMVPECVAEVWVVDVPLKKSQQFYSSFHAFVAKELERFERVDVSEAYSHPRYFNISDYTKVSKHDFDKPALKVTFVWREDRIWLDRWLFKALRRSHLWGLGLWLQNRKVQALLAQVKKDMPAATLCVAGFGATTTFPAWIEDQRVTAFDANTERHLCQVYADSRVIVGIHGSNMLLPSGHAGMTIDLLPKKRLGNFAQDILYQEEDPRMAAFRYRYIADDIEPVALSYVIANMVSKYEGFQSQMCADQLTVTKLTIKT